MCCYNDEVYNSRNDILRDNCSLIYRILNFFFFFDLRNILATIVTVRLFSITSINMIDEIDIVVIKITDDKIVTKVSIIVKVS